MNKVKRPASPGNYSILSPSSVESSPEPVQKRRSSMSPNHYERYSGRLSRFTLSNGTTTSGSNFGISRDLSDADAQKLLNFAEEVEKMKSVNTQLADTLKNYEVTLAMLKMEVMKLRSQIDDHPVSVNVDPKLLEKLMEKEKPVVINITMHT